MQLLKYIICISFVLFSFSSNAQVFRTTFSGLGNLNNGKYNFIEKEGGFTTKNNNFNLGLSINTSYYPIKDNNWYLSLGVRINTTESSISVVNRIEGISLATPPVTWGYRWRAMTIPFHVGKTIIPFKNNDFNISIYGGISYGVIRGAMSHYDIIVMKSKDDDDLVGAGFNHEYTDNIFDQTNLMTIDIGLSITPIPSLPRFNVGFVYVYNLNATKNIRGAAFLTNVSQQQFHEYYYNMNRRFNNFTFSISYSLGKTSFERRMKIVDCLRI